ncbi:MAG: membrane protein insertion efficiency factor YidD [bacterium]|nr:membrane protein insertion efficiency factor YidD [bacterium]
MVVSKVIPLSLILLVLSSPQSFGEESFGLQFILTSNPLLQQEKKPEVTKEESELKLFFLGGIRFYQLFISPQDVPSCAFSPSCSHFGLEAIKRYNILKGILLTSDRLQRCHAWAGEYYPLDERSKKAVDPINNYSFKEDK